MGIYAYHASNADGDVNGTINADSSRQAREKLRAQGLKITDMAESRDHGAMARGKWRFVWERRPETHVTSFAQELSTLLNAGIPLLDSLDAISPQYSGHFGAGLITVRDQIAAGTSLAEAFRQQPRYFDELCVSMIDVGERTGMLDQSLSQLADYRRRSQQLKGKIATALIYPSIVACAGLAVTIFLCTFVVPRLLETLTDAGRPLPLMTRIVKGFSDMLVNYGWGMLLLAIVLTLITAVLIRRPRIRRAWHRLQLHLPLLGHLIRLQMVVRMAVMLATLTRSGMEFVHALRLVARAMPNLVIQDALERCQAAILAGRDIGPALAATNVFPPPVICIMEVGQATGHLDQMLERLAVDYDLQVQTATARLLAAFEPAMILLLAGLVGFIVLSVILPYLEAGNVL